MKAWGLTTARVIIASSDKYSKFHTWRVSSQCVNPFMIPSWNRFHFNTSCYRKPGKGEANDLNRNLQRENQTRRGGKVLTPVMVWASSRTTPSLNDTANFRLPNPGIPDPLFFGEARQRIERAFPSSNLSPASLLNILRTMVWQIFHFDPANCRQRSETRQ